MVSKHMVTKTSIDYIVACCFTGVGVVAFVVLSALSYRWLRRADDIDHGVALGLTITFPILALIIVGAFIGGAWPPFNMEYHSYKQVTGTVADVQTRFLGDGKSTSQFYAVRFTDSDQIYRCDDTRCSLAKPGDHLWLWCIREWQQASTPGYDCNYDRAEAKS